MKRIAIIMTVASMSITLSGCNSTSAERVALLEHAIGQVNTASAELDRRIADVNDLVTATAAVLADPNIPDQAVQEFGDKLVAAQAQAQNLLTAKAQVDAILQDLQNRLAAVQAKGDIDLSDELKLAAATLAATGQATGGKTGIYLALAASILGVIAGAMPAGRKASKATQALTEVVLGNEAFKKASIGENGPSAETVIKPFKTSQLAAQSPATTKLVASIRRQVT